MSDDYALDRLEENPAVQRAIVWWEALPEPRNPHDLPRYLHDELVRLGRRAVDELPVDADDIRAVFDPEAVSVAPTRTFLDSPPTNLTPAQRASWAAIAEERDQLVTGLAGLRAHIALLGAEIQLSGPEDGSP